MSRYVLLLFLPLMLVGCHTSRPARRASAPDWESPEFAAAQQPAPPKPVAPTAPSNAPKAASLGSAQINQPPMEWISLERWCRDNHHGEPVPAPGNPPKCAVHTDAGSFLFRAGTTTAFWNGGEVRLGFAPQYTNGSLMLHSLDLQKTVEPLVSEPRLLPRERVPVVVIDPGHGGSDPGAHSPGATRFEKEFTLDWARRLAPILASNGWQVFTTRTADADVPLASRVAFAEAHHADLFVSLHFNSSVEGRQQGIETYCLTPHGMQSSINRGYDDDASASFPNNAFDASNIALAYRVHTAVVRESGGNDRGVRRARFPAVLKNQNRPAVLVEGGYISSAEEAGKISDPTYRQKLAEAVASAIVDCVKPRSEAEAGALETAGAADLTGRAKTSATP